jgi:hypothetical protein
MSGGADGADFPDEYLLVSTFHHLHGHHGTADKAGKQ